MPQSQIFSAFSDSRGYLWLGTQGGGLSRFDGRSFKNFSTRNGLPSNYLQTIFEDADQQIWAGTRRGLCYFDGLNFHAITSSDNPDLGEVTAIAQKTDSSLWIGSNQGLYEYIKPQGRLQKLKLNVVLDQLFIYAFYPSSQGLWVATDRGAWFLGENALHFDRSKGLSSEAVRAFTRGPKQQLWILTYNQGVSILNEARMEVVAYKKTPYLNRGLCLFTDSEKNIWMGTQDRGIFIYVTAEDRWINITEKQGLPHNHIRAIFSDRWGNIWTASSGGGVAKYLGQFFVNFDRNNGLKGNRVYALCENSHKQIWASASSNGITLYDSLGLRPLGRDSALLNVRIKTIAEDAQSRMWVGTEGRGLFLFDSASVRRFTQREGLPSDWIRKIIVDERGHIWVATHADGVAHIRGVDQRGLIFEEKIGRAQGLSDLQISTMKMDERHRIWFASRNGSLGYFENGKLNNIDQSKAGLPKVDIRTMAFDSLDRIWIGTAGDGVLYSDLNEMDFKPVEAISGELSSQNIYLLIFDLAGNLWAGNERGVDKISFNTSGVATDIQHFGKNEGFLGIETCQDAALLDHKGNLWFGAMNGLVKHSPEAQRIETSAPLIHFRKVSLFYKALEETPFAQWATPKGGIRPGLQLPYWQNHLGFAFKALNLSDPQDVRYRWRLEGQENDWSPLNQDESISYSNLPPGDYTFSVQACNGEENCSAPIQASFSIEEPFWQTAWFQFSAALLIIALILGVFRWRIRLVKRKEKARREKLEVQNHLLQLEQKALQLQMNPHFIFNALNSIQSLVSTRDYQTARQELHHFAALMRIILSNSRKQKISLQEEIDMLEKYLRMEQFCQRVKFDFNILAPSDADPEDLSIPPMLIQPYVENAVIHGISHLNRRGRITIRFSLEKEILKCAVTDNGVGRKKAAELRQLKKPGHQSTAMQVTEERLQALFVEQADVEALKIYDLFDEAGVAAGTEVLIRIPVELAF